jgi:hypothetical protein
MAFNLVEELRVYCANRDKGCGFVVTRYVYQTHLFKSQRQHLATHLQNECEEVIVPCKKKLGIQLKI